jgi:hypothetical protein
VLAHSHAEFARAEGTEWQEDRLETEAFELQRRIESEQKQLEALNNQACMRACIFAVSSRI